MAMDEFIFTEFYEFPASFQGEAQKSLLSCIDLVTKKYKLVSPQRARADICIKTQNVLAYDQDYQCNVVHKILVKIIASNSTASAIKKDQSINPERWYS